MGDRIRNTAVLKILQNDSRNNPSPAARELPLHKGALA